MMWLNFGDDEEQAILLNSFMGDLNFGLEAIAVPRRLALENRRSIAPKYSSARGPFPGGNNDARIASLAPAPDRGPADWLGATDRDFQGDRDHETTSLSTAAVGPVTVAHPTLSL